MYNFVFAFLSDKGCGGQIARIYRKRAAKHVQRFWKGFSTVKKIIREPIMDHGFLYGEQHLCPFLRAKAPGHQFIK